MPRYIIGHATDAKKVEVMEIAQGKALSQKQWPDIYTMIGI